MGRGFAQSKAGRSYVTEGLYTIRIVGETGLLALVDDLHRRPCWGSRDQMRNVVIVATAGTDPISLLTLLGQHPEIVAPPALRLTAMLHGTSRGIVRSLKPNPSTPEAPFPFARLDTTDIARRTCCTAIDHVFAQLRQTASGRTVVVWDPEGLTFPFIDPPDIHLLLLVRDPVSAARRLAGGAYLEEISAEVGRHLLEATARPRSWGLAEERVLSIDEDDLDGADALQQLLEFLDVASDAHTIDRLLTARPVPPFEQRVR